MAEPIAYRSLIALAQAEAQCTRCPLYKDATQVVPGEGSPRARVMMVGEQPGDKEDLEGRPFVGPAGRMLDRAIAEAGLDRRKVFVTNAVKHFKFEQRGKRRLHKKPNGPEIEACFPWLKREVKLVQPRLIVALGATGLRALMGKAVPVLANRGQTLTSVFDLPTFVTVHPSALLRIPEPEDRREAFDAFVGDLKKIGRLVVRLRDAA
jgi:uracil-DNA glycosylase family protein